MPKRTATSPGTSRPMKKAKPIPTPPYITSKLGFSATAPVQPPTISNSKRGLHKALLEQAGDIATYGLSKTAENDLKMRTAASIGVLSIMDDAIFEAMNMRSARKFTNTFGFQAKDLLDRWANKSKRQKGVGRSKDTTDAQKEVKRWYALHCTLTGITKPVEAAHIFPHPTERNEFGLESFFDMLELFWAESEVEALRQHLALPEHEKTNILVISEDAHTLWDDHRWCVDPVDDGSDNNSMVLEFLWLAQAHTPTSAVDHTTPRANMRIAVDDGPTMRRLASGDRITLRTVDAKLYPLPDRRILKLQKALHMALRASAAAEVTDLLFPRNPPSSSPPVSIPKDAEESTTPDFTSFVLEAAVENCSINKTELPGLWESYGLESDKLGASPRDPF
ncbi:hypothetical protein GE09DRAFT_763068 [Coniochaeta sp. 2T2.1]|nr:hypothetical protein GE09DRAFT_763068 [Coniochaeta sp. 2T2.1]